MEKNNIKQIDCSSDTIICIDLPTKITNNSNFTLIEQFILLIMSWEEKKLFLFNCEKDIKQRELFFETNPQIFTNFGKMYKIYHKSKNEICLCYPQQIII